MYTGEDVTLPQACEIVEGDLPVEEAVHRNAPPKVEQFLLGPQYIRKNAEDKDHDMTSLSWSLAVHQYSKPQTEHHEATLFTVLYMPLLNPVGEDVAKLFAFGKIIDGEHWNYAEFSNVTRPDILPVRFLIETVGSKIPEQLYVVLDFNKLDVSVMSPSPEKMPVFCSWMYYVLAEPKMLGDFFIDPEWYGMDECRADYVDDDLVPEYPGVDAESDVGFMTGAQQVRELKNIDPDMMKELIMGAPDDFNKIRPSLKLDPVKQKSVLEACTRTEFPCDWIIMKPGKDYGLTDEHNSDIYIKILNKFFQVHDHRGDVLKLRVISEEICPLPPDLEYRVPATPDVQRLKQLMLVSLFGTLTVASCCLRIVSLIRLRYESTCSFIPGKNMKHLLQSSHT